MSDQKWIRFAAITVSGTGALVAGYLLCKFALGLFSPFLLAFLVAALAWAGARRLSRYVHAKERILALILVLVILLAVGGGAYFLFSRVLVELQELLRHILADSDDPEGVLARLWGFFDRLGERWNLGEGGVLESFIGEPADFFAEQFKNFIASLSERVPAGVTALASALPRILVFLLVTLMACFYMTLDYPRITQTLSNALPLRLREALPAWRCRVAEGLSKYLRAYFVLFLLTVGELWIGLFILRVRYSLLLSILVALLDALPVLGVGTVLIPWALLSLLSGNPYLGIGLLILFGVVSVVRQVAEPHLVGKSLGLHPLLMLVGFFAGLKLFGVMGVFLGPAIVLILKSFWKSDRKNGR